MKVTVLLATYNRGFVIGGMSLIERSINSFLAQDYDNATLLILNDGSTDNTRELLSSYASHPKIDVFDFMPNKLPPNNWNWLWEKATGELVCQLHDDDELTPDSLSLRVELFRKDPELQVVYGGVIVQDLSVTYQQPVLAGPVSVERILKEEYINFTTLMYRREIGFKFDPTLRYYFDWLFKIRCLKECKVGYTSKPVMVYTTHQGQESNKCRRENMNEPEERKMREKLLSLYP